MIQVLATPLREMPLGMQLAFAAIVFMIGASLGSFLAAAVYRATTSKKSIAFDRSECTTCGRKLTVIDLVPIFSFLLLRARCRTCKKPISWRYIFIETSCAMMATVIVYRVGFSLSALELMVASLILFAVLLIDFDTWLIPTLLPVFLMAWGLAFSAWQVSSVGIIESAVGLVTGFGFLALVLVVSTWLLRRTGRLSKGETAMGWGDPILMGGIGALVGVKLLPFVLWLACIQAIVMYVVLRIRQRDFAALAEDAHAEQGFEPPARALPLGTFLCLGAIEVILGRLFL